MKIVSQYSPYHIFIIWYEIWDSLYGKSKEINYYKNNMYCDLIEEYLTKCDKDIKPFGSCILYWNRDRLRNFHDNLLELKNKLNESI